MNYNFNLSIQEIVNNLTRFIGSKKFLNLAKKYSKEMFKKRPQNYTTFAQFFPIAGDEGIYQIFDCKDFATFKKTRKNCPECPFGWYIYAVMRNQEDGELYFIHQFHETGRIELISHQFFNDWANIMGYPEEWSLNEIICQFGLDIMGQKNYLMIDPKTMEACKPFPEYSIIGHGRKEVIDGELVTVLTSCSNDNAENSVMNGAA